MSRLRSAASARRTRAANASRPLSKGTTPYSPACACVSGAIDRPSVLPPESSSRTDTVRTLSEGKAAHGDVTRQRACHATVRLHSLRELVGEFLLLTAVLVEEQMQLVERGA